LIRVHAAGVIPTELGWYPTWHQKSGEPRGSAVPGHEFSGTIAAIGNDAGSLARGDEVFGMNDWYSEGAMAEYCVAPFSAVAAKPKRLTHVEAASVPISALTAWQALFDHARVQSGERVLIHGGAGGVGSFAVQLAASRGAHVIATVSARNIEFVKSLGAHDVIDYRTARFEDSANKADVVLDTVGGETLERSWNVLASGGRLLTVASTAEASKDPRVKKSFFIVEPNGNQLAAIGALLQEGKLRPFVDAVVPFSSVSEAYAGTVKRPGRGKIVVIVSEGTQPKP